MNINKLKGKMVEKEMSVEKLASLLGQNRATVYRKMKGGDNFTVGEVSVIKTVLEMTNEEASAIFFD